MSRRPSFRLTLPILGAAAVVVVALSASCGGNPYGECVTVYRDGDVFRYDTDKAYCEETCAERLAESSDIISSCYFAGSKASPTEP